MFRRLGNLKIVTFHKRLILKILNVLSLLDLNVFEHYDSIS